MPESITSIYKKLFTVRFIHNGYETPWENFLSKGISITADTATLDLFTSYNIDYRFYNNTLTCFIRCVLLNPPALQPKIPFLTIDKPVQLRFLLHSSNDFLNKTYVTAAGSKKMYRFSNQVNNTSAGNLFLNNNVAGFSAGSDYDAGTIVQDGGNLYTCLKPVLAADGIALSDTSYWKLLQAVEQVVSNADLQDTVAVKAEETCMGVIDIYNTGTTNNSYKLFDTGGELFNPAPVFTIQFKSRT